MILICDNCHYIFDYDIIEKHPVSPEKIFPESCPFCGATSVTCTISANKFHAKEAFPALRYATPGERTTYEKAVLKARGSIPQDETVKKARAKLEEALALINLSADKLSNDEYNMLLIFAFLYGYSTDARAWLKPILGLERFRPGSQGKPADPQYDTIRVYENVTKVFSSFIKRVDRYPDSLSSVAVHVASMMRHGITVSAKRSMVRTYKATIKNISMQTLCKSPGEVYLETINNLMELWEK